MLRLFESATDLTRDADRLRRRRFGVIEVAAGRLSAIRLRPFPKCVSLVETWCFGETFHGKKPGDVCWLYYDQPWGCSNYLAVKYALSTRDCSFASLRGALLVLDEVARIKGTDAIVCHVTNSRISDRLLHRFGWEQHLAESPRRHFIKRFYGTYPDPAPAIAVC